MREKPRCYFCSASGLKLRLQEFYVTIRGKPVLEKHRVCGECEKKHLWMYH